MENELDYHITKLEKGPLQRFKNQNLLLKKFGEIGLRVYKVITGNRTSEELRKDLDIDQAMFSNILSYMEEAGMIQLEPVGKSKMREKPGKKIAEAEEEAPESEVETSEEELSQKTEFAEDEFAVEERGSEEQSYEKEQEEPEEEIVPFEVEEAREEKQRKGKKWQLSKESVDEEEIVPEEELEESSSKPKKKKTEEEIVPEEEESVSEENIEEYEKKEHAAAEETTEQEDLDLSNVDEEELLGENEDDTLSPVEKIIKDKYGDVGLRVYTLIDGARTAEEIMKETGLSESKLVEILDFMDEQGIIKLDYPAGAKGSSSMATEADDEAKESITDEFTPMIDSKTTPNDDEAKVLSPVEVPARVSIDIVKSVQLKAKTLLKFGDSGGKVYEQINGTNNVIDISLKLSIPLYTVMEIMRFLVQNGGIALKPMSREDIRKKYGDDGYAVYKKYGKEGLALYDLIGKDMSIKQMAERVTKDKTQVVEMFIFIHKVLGIELPIDRAVLEKQLN